MAGQPNSQTPPVAGMVVGVARRLGGEGKTPTVTNQGLNKAVSSIADGHHHLRSAESPRRASEGQNRQCWPGAGRGGSGGLGPPGQHYESTAKAAEGRRAGLGNRAHPEDFV